MKKILLILCTLFIFSSTSAIHWGKYLNPFNDDFKKQISTIEETKNLEEKINKYCHLLLIIVSTVIWKAPHIWIYSPEEYIVLPHAKKEVFTIVTRRLMFLLYSKLNEIEDDIREADSSEKIEKLKETKKDYFDVLNNINETILNFKESQKEMFFWFVKKLPEILASVAVFTICVLPLLYLAKQDIIKWKKRSKLKKIRKEIDSFSTEFQNYSFDINPKLAFKQKLFLDFIKKTKNKDRPLILKKAIKMGEKLLFNFKFELYKRESFKQYYEILGLTTKATFDEVKTAYRKLVLQYHPDKAPNGKEVEYEEIFKNIADAYKKIDKMLNENQSYNPEIENHSDNSHHEVEDVD